NRSRAGRSPRGGSTADAQPAHRNRPAEPATLEADTRRSTMSDDDTRHSGSRWEPDRQDGHQDTADDRTDEVATGPADHPAEEVATEPAGDAAAPHIPLTSWPPVSDSSLFAMPPIPA